MRMFCKVSLDAHCRTCRGLGIYEINYIQSKSRTDHKRLICHCVSFSIADELNRTKPEEPAR